MNVYKHLPASISALIFFVAPVFAFAQTPSAIEGVLRVNQVLAVSDDSQLKSFVHPVNTQSGSGSCVTIGRKGDLYFAITAAHVVAKSSISGGFAVNINGTDYKASMVSSFGRSGSDLALISFRYTGELAVAILHPSLVSVMQKEESFLVFDYKSINQKNNVISVVGYSMPSDAVSKSIFRKITVSLHDRIDGNKDGYEFAYDAATYPGMSGGGIFAWVMNNSGNWKPNFPVLIGIHGKSEGYSEGGRSGVSLGVPIDVISKQLEGESERLGLPSKSKDILLRLSEYKNVCWIKKTFKNGSFVCES